eukprot:TRINITY_DN6972_c0_g1_i3.p1 TRINITY_DN6972_c0_g1~~TRINITY_DN6972_c0_g1_i3.p1  ORF type:complete len:1953 (-),score=306.09 TRINITY_DN6972_c0_g1_i3:279-6137(-)
MRLLSSREVSAAPARQLLLDLLVAFAAVGARGSLLEASQKELLECCTPVEHSLQVVNNNLNMLGPGDVSSSPNIRVSGLTSGCGTEGKPRLLDAELVSTGSYRSSATKQNGVKNGMLRVNVDAGSSVDLTLFLLDSESNQEVRVKELVLFVYNLVQAGNQTSLSAVTVKDFKDVHISDGTTLEQSFNHTSKQTWFVSSAAASADGEPTDPNDLSRTQRDRSVAYRLTDVDQVSLSFRVSEGRQGHTFLLAVTSCSCCHTDMVSELNTVQLYDNSYAAYQGGAASDSTLYGGQNSNGGYRVSRSSYQSGDGTSYHSSSYHSSGGTSYHSSSYHGSGGSSYQGSTLHGSGGTSYHSSSYHGNGGSSYQGSTYHGSHGASYHSSAYQGSGGSSYHHSSASYSQGGSTHGSHSSGRGDRHEQKEMIWQVAGARTCSGSEIEWGACPDQPSCNSCIPQDCRFAAWGQWYDAGGCTGLCFRHRGLAQPNNECGQPCNGVQEATKPCIKRECAPAHAQDCILEEWSEWSPCANMQRDRHRVIAQQPAHGGKSCAGELREAKPCGQVSVQDCQLNEWSEWTTCSCTCGQGWHTRDRRIVKFASYGGKPCTGSTREEAPCNIQPCRGSPCVLSAWSEWVGCDPQSPMQRERTRRVDHPGTAGQGCSGATRETEGCQGIRPQDCAFSQWTEWSTCDKHCGGGQRYREQKLLSPAHGGGTCISRPMKQVQACNEQDCKLEDNDCVLSAWGEWSECSAKCETGVHRRTRQVDRRAGPGGKGCKTALMELESCQGSDCQRVDCRWGQWDPWSDCSCSCGGGTKRRNRQVAVSPKGGGMLCDVLDKSEAAPCNTISCESTCVDGVWGEWTSWSECSATCGFSFKWRHRAHEVQANSCGKPAVGKGQEWLTCKGSGTGSSACGDIDGRLSEWNTWSDCSCTCFGIRERQRIIERYHSGHGKSIAKAPLKMIEACNPASGQRAPSACIHEASDCRLNPWSEWSECPVTCGGGNHMRLRYILSPASNNGKPCKASLRETQACGTTPCGHGCVDCLWGAWSEWGACSKCGDQRFRERDITRLPNHCGKPCDARTAKEVTSCNSTCVKHQFCVWKPWASWSGCSASCGPASRMRQRNLGLVRDQPLDFLFKVAEDTMAGVCAGNQVDTEACPVRACDDTCTAKDCLFSEWGEWNQPTCIGLCTRNRYIQQMNNECGRPCDGPLVGTKRCVEKCTAKLDCELRAWSSWSQYDRQGAGAQRYRSREVSQLPKNGGEPCHGTLREVDSPSAAAGAESTQDCWLATWSDWFGCSKTCGGGWKVRTRAMSQAAAGGGRPCDGDMSQGEPCGLADCPESDCILGEWSEWSACWADGQRSRSRHIQQPASTGGRSCGSPGTPLPLTETMSCSQQGTDCQVSEWTHWDACDKSCGGGEQQRHRQVQVYPMSGGRPCPTSLRELRGCNPGGCGSTDCQVSHWSEWGTCSSNCGSGQQIRERQVTSPAIGAGQPCDYTLAETRPCQDNGGGSMPECGVVNCRWGDWSAWSGCTCSCGGGQRTRNRHIATTPQGGGAICDAVNKEEIEPCNTDKCSEFGCQDGRWGQWEEWSQCSASCAGGLRYRRRKMEKEANDCGKPAVGASRDTDSCNAGIACSGDLDCKFGEWSEWSACTRTCDGTKRRSRRIAVQGRGNGRWCRGSTKESSPCNPSPGVPAPNGCRADSKQDCVMSQWTEWSECDQTCGGGQMRRERSVDTEATGGGKTCGGHLSETTGCASQPCHAERHPQDCQWGEWSSWGACNKCGGQRERFRHIVREALYGGQPCELGAGEETADCPRQCHERSYCVWNPWGEWSSCSQSCGIGGVRHRQRSLDGKGESEVKALGLLYEDREAVASLPSVLSQGFRFEVIAAFACGMVGTVVLGQISRALPSRAAARGSMVSAMETPQAEGGLFRRLFAGRSDAPGAGYMPVSTEPLANELDA